MVQFARVQNRVRRAAIALPGQALPLLAVARFHHARGLHLETQLVKVRGGWTSNGRATVQDDQHSPPNERIDSSVQAELRYGWYFWKDQTPKRLRQFQSFFRLFPIATQSIPSFGIRDVNRKP